MCVVSTAIIVLVPSTCRSKGENGGKLTVPSCCRHAVKIDEEGKDRVVVCDGDMMPTDMERLLRESPGVNGPRL